MPKQWYPYDRLGGMYVHTNYESFKSNWGSFGKRSELDSYLLGSISMQNQREEQLGNAINMLLNDLDGDSDSSSVDGFERLLKWFDDQTGFFKKVLEDEHGDDYLVDEVTKKLADIDWWTFAAHTSDIEEAAQKIEFLFLSVTEAIEEATNHGILNLESFSNAKERIEIDIQNLRDMPYAKQTTGIKGAVTSLKGFIFELYVARFMLAALKFIDESAGENAHIVLQDRKKVADMVVDLSGMMIGINIKSASRKTFRGTGVSLLSGGTLNSVLGDIETRFQTDAIEALKYYIINISRMRAFSLTGQTGSPTITHSAEGYALYKQVLKTYATFFIGEGPATSDQLEHIKQGDILITRDLAIRKSDILMGLYLDQEFAILGKIGYNKGEAGWGFYDMTKASMLSDSQGDYGAVASFGREASDTFMKQSFTIKLKLTDLLNQARN